MHIFCRLSRKILRPCRKSAPQTAAMRFFQIVDELLWSLSTRDTRAYRIGLTPSLVGARAHECSPQGVFQAAKLPEKRISFSFRLAAKTLRDFVCSLSAVSFAEAALFCRSARFIPLFLFSFLFIIFFICCIFTRFLANFCEYLCVSTVDIRAEQAYDL